MRVSENSIVIVFGEI